MSEPILLKNAGDKHVMDVASCGLLPFGKYKEYEFVGRDGSRVRVPQQSAERQLVRLGLTPEAIVGRRVTLKRDPSTDPAKPFWGIYLEDGEYAQSGYGNGGPSNGGTAATTQPAATPKPEPVKPKVSGHELYEKITDYVLATIKPKYDKAGIGLSPEATAAICATLYIGAQKNGH